MAGQPNAVAPVIVKKRRTIIAGGHHGGAWKVAYADFVTAMMAFFMLMWLLNATTEKQRKGLADYFNPTIPVNRVSGGGDDAFGGDSVFSEDVRVKTGTGAAARAPTEQDKARGAEAGEGADRELKADLDAALAARAGESMTMQRALRHVVTRVTDEGLVIELFDLDDAPLFAAETAEPLPVTQDLALLLSDVLALATNRIAVGGHVRAYPLPLADNPAWALSMARAQAFRGLLEGRALPPGRFERVTGFADRRPVTADPAAVRNNRLEIVLLRTDR